MSEALRDIEYVEDEERGYTNRLAAVVLADGDDEDGSETVAEKIGHDGYLARDLFDAEFFSVAGGGGDNDGRQHHGPEGVKAYDKHNHPFPPGWEVIRVGFVGDGEKDEIVLVFGWSLHRLVDPIKLLAIPSESK